MHEVQPRTPSVITIPSSVLTNPSASNTTYLESPLEGRIVTVFRIGVRVIAAESIDLIECGKVTSQGPL